MLIDSLQTDYCVNQLAKWPAGGRHILAQFDDISHRLVSCARLEAYAASELGTSASAGASFVRQVRDTIAFLRCGSQTSSGKLQDRLVTLVRIGLQEQPHASPPPFALQHTFLND